MIHINLLTFFFSTSMVDSSTMTVTAATSAATKSSIPDLVLTYEKEASMSSKQKADKLLLPKSFYDGTRTAYNETVVLSDDNNIEVTHAKPSTVDDVKISKISDLFRVLKRFDSNEFNLTLFEEEATIFKLMRISRDWIECDSVRVLIVESIDSKHLVLFVKKNDAYLEREIVSEMSLELRQDDYTMLEWIVPSHFGHETYAIKFHTMLMAENFNELFTANQRETTEKTAITGPVFGSTSSAVSFASLAESGLSGFASNAGQQFAGAGKSLFGAKEEDDGDGGHEVYFEPIVQLSTVSVTSGEEEEDCYFNQRCKLYRFDNGKWKERGVGEMKLLRHRVSAKARLVMRRDQVRKLCANHYINAEMKLEPFKTNELTVTWTAFNDSSEGISEDILLAAKFKNITILSEFKHTFSRLSEDDVNGLTAIEQKGPEEGSEARALIGSCDPSLTETINDLKV